MNKLLSLALGLIVLATTQSFALTDQECEDLYNRAVAIQAVTMPAMQPLPVNYFQLLNEAAVAGHKPSTEILEQHARTIFNTMNQNVVWGSSPEADAQIRGILQQYQQ